MMKIDEISFFPFIKELKGYSFRSLYGDFTAAISVALLTLPQAMAYALIAGLPLSTGLFAAAFSSLIAAFFGSSRQLVVGPSNAIAILIQYGTAEILYTYYRGVTGIERDIVAMQIVTQLTLFVGILHLLAASFRLTRLTQFVSQSVIVGYIVGCAIAIFVNQLNVFFGIAGAAGVGSLFAKGAYLITHIHEIHPMSTFIGLSSVGIILFFKRFNKRIPGAAIAFGAVTIFVYLCKLVFPGITEGVLLVESAGTLSGAVVHLSLPHFEPSILNQLLPLAFAVALLGILETNSVSKSVAASTGQRVSSTQEIFGLGLGNVFSAFIGAMPISGSMSRTTLNLESGAQTRFAAIMGASLVGFIVYALGSVVTQIPLASLSALLLVTAFNIVKKDQVLLCLKSTKADAVVFWITLFSCIFLSIDIAFYTGVVISIIHYLQKSAVPQVLQYTVDEAGRLKNLEYCSSEEMGQIRFIKVKGELFFGAADLFQATVKSFAENDTSTRVMILQLKNARDIDATVCLALRQLHDYLRSSGRYLIMSGLTFPIWEVLSSSGIVKEIGKENLFVIDDRNPNAYFDKAIKRAQHLADLPLKGESAKGARDLTTETTERFLQAEGYFA